MEDCLAPAVEFDPDREVDPVLFDPDRFASLLAVLSVSLGKIDLTHVPTPSSHGRFLSVGRDGSSCFDGAGNWRVIFATGDNRV